MATFQLKTTQPTTQVWQRLSSSAFLQSLQQRLQSFGDAEPKVKNGNVFWEAKDLNGQIEVIPAQDGSYVLLQVNPAASAGRFHSSLEGFLKDLREAVETELGISSLAPAVGAETEPAPGGMRAYGLVAERGEQLEPEAPAPGGMKNYGVNSLESGERTERES